jgi:TonB family protein
VPATPVRSAPVGPAPVRPASGNGIPARPVGSALPSAGTASAAPKRTPANTRPLPPASPAPQKLRKTEPVPEEILPLAGALQASAEATQLDTISFPLPPLSRAKSESGPVFGSAEPDAAPNRSFAMAGIGGVVLAAVLAAGWMLTRKRPPAATQPAPQVVAQQPAVSTQANTLPSEAPPHANPAQAKSPLTGEISLRGATKSGLPVSASPPSRSPRPQARVAEPQEKNEENSVVFPVEGAIRRPATVAKPFVDPVAPVQPPTAVIGGASTTSVLPPPTNQSAPRLATPPPPTNPQVMRRVEPRRPANAQSLSGTVVLSATIGTDGKPTDIKAVSGHPLLVAAAIAAFRDWQYEPARRDGAPTTAAVQVRFVFRPE